MMRSGMAFWVVLLVGGLWHHPASSQALPADARTVSAEAEAELFAVIVQTVVDNAKPGVDFEVDPRPGDPDRGFQAASDPDPNLVEVRRAAIAKLGLEPADVDPSRYQPCVGVMWGPPPVPEELRAGCPASEVVTLIVSRVHRTMECERVELVGKRRGTCWVALGQREELGPNGFVLYIEEYLIDHTADGELAVQVRMIGVVE